MYSLIMGVSWNMDFRQRLCMNLSMEFYRFCSVYLCSITKLMLLPRRMFVPG